MKITKTMNFRNFIALFLITLLLSCNRSIYTEQTEILWDKWGVPHIYANNESEMYYAFGWAQMQNHADLILKMYAESRGKASEFYGESHLFNDRLIHLYNIPDSAEAQYSRYSGEQKEYLDAFVKGMNDYAQSKQSKIDLTAQKILPITAIDIISHTKRVMNIEFLGKRDIMISYNELKSSINEPTPGSNSYAIGPSKTESGNAMLVANPHLPWSDFYLFFEAHLNAPDFTVYGVTLVGMPVLNIAFNENLGWTHTVNTIDASDRYELTLKDDGYLLDGHIKPFVEKKVTTKVLQNDGSLKEEEINLKYSEHGPVISENDSVAYAVRIAGLDKDSYFDQYHQMGKADNFNKFEEALQMMQIPMFNVVYADRDGNIMYLFNGNIPVREKGNWSFWNRKIDGTKSELIWDSYHEYSDLPKLFNPETGYVQNANDAPWTATYPVLLDNKDYPVYISPSPHNTQTSFRAQRAINLIKDDDSITFERLVDYKLDTGMEVADRFLKDLLDAIELFPNNKVAQEAAAALKEWDGETNTDSKGAVLFANWFEKIDSELIETPWSSDNPVTTPSGLSNPEKVVALLTDAANEVKDQYGSIDVAWGEVNFFRVGDNEFPANGGHHNFGVFRTMYFQPNSNNNKNYVYHGDTFVAVVEFGDEVRADVLLSYGNATQKGNPFVGDQLEMLSENRLRKAFLNKEEVLNNLFEKVVLK